MLNQFLQDKSRAHLLMLAALALLLVSQFFLYFDDPSRGSLDESMDGRSYNLPKYGTRTVDFESFGQGVLTGWELHPQAYAILVILAFAFLSPQIYEATWFRRFGWWIAVGLVVWAMSPGAPFMALGAGMGGVAFLMALAAAALNLRNWNRTEGASA